MSIDVDEGESSGARHRISRVEHIGGFLAIPLRRVMHSGVSDEKWWTNESVEQQVLMIW